MAKGLEIKKSDEHIILEEFLNGLTPRETVDNVDLGYKISTTSVRKVVFKHYGRHAYQYPKPLGKKWVNKILKVWDEEFNIEKIRSRHCLQRNKIIDTIIQHRHGHYTIEEIFELKYTYKVSSHLANKLSTLGEKALQKEMNRLKREEMRKTINPKYLVRGEVSLRPLGSWGY